MQHEYYKEYYDLERKHWWFVAREKILSNYLSKLVEENQFNTKELKILNIGCGPGRTSEKLSEFGQVISVEYDKFCCEFAAEKTGLEIINASITELPFENNSFDLVCAFDVIEHVEDDSLAVSEMKRVAKKGGILMVTVPAYMSLWSRHDEVNHHYRRYRLNEVEKLFFSNNKVQKLFSSYFNFFLFPPIYFFRRVSTFLKLEKRGEGSGSDFEAFNPGLVNNILFNIMKFESRLINKKIKLPFGVSIFYCCKINE